MSKCNSNTCGNMNEFMVSLENGKSSEPCTGNTGCDHVDNVLLEKGRKWGDWTANRLATASAITSTGTRC